MRVPQRGRTVDDRSHQSAPFSTRWTVSETPEPKGKRSHGAAAPSAVRARLGITGVNVLVEAEQVGRIVFPLQCSETPVVPAHCRSHEPRIFPETREVHV